MRRCNLVTPEIGSNAQSLEVAWPRHILEDIFPNPRMFDAPCLLTYGFKPSRYLLPIDIVHW